MSATDKRIGTRKFGWCLDGHHTTCPVTHMNGGVCSCECHNQEKQD